MHLKGGKVSGNVYGGAYGSTSKLEGTARVTLSGAELAKDLYGAGYGQNTRVESGVEILLESGVIAGNVFAAGNSTTVSGGTSVVLDGATVNGAIYGGNVGGTNGTYGNLQGGSTIIINSGRVNRVYGAGSRGKNFSGDIHIVFSGGEITDRIYGGCSTEGTISDITIEMTGGTVGRIYGGCETAEQSTATSNYSYPVAR